jgi:hypothetical protein
MIKIYVYARQFYGTPIAIIYECKQAIKNSRTKKPLFFKKNKNQKELKGIKMINERNEIIEEGVIFDDLDIEEMEAIVAPGFLLAD